MQTLVSRRKAPVEARRRQYDGQTCLDKRVGGGRTLEGVDDRARGQAGDSDRNRVCLPNHEALVWQKRRHLLAKLLEEIVEKLRAIHVVLLHPTRHGRVLRKAGRPHLVSAKEQVRVREYHTCVTNAGFSYRGLC